MERTFCAISLKLSLRTINNRSKPNFIMFDEILGKLSTNSISEFKNFIEKAKSKINKIYIIEHNHTLEYDHLIQVNKNKDGVSSLEMS